jgi:hypothetical protein
MRRIDLARSVVSLGAAALVTFAVPTRAIAQLPIPVLIEGLTDWEFWSTTGNSNLLTRNAGRWEGVARGQLWGAVEPLPGLVFYGQGGVYGAGVNSATRSFTYASEQYGVRYIASRALVIDAGKLQPIFGTFASRRFSNRNPLIGSPDGYSLEYPLGVEISGERRFIDYRAALVTLPSTHAGYVPAATPRLRPVIGAGVTPMVGLRIGGSFTTGSYLNDSYTAAQLSNRTWSDYHQRVVAVDLAFSRGYLETHAEAARGSYDVPGHDHAVMGYTYYGEAKYTLTPRFFVAGRAERNNYPFIRALTTGAWIGRLTDFVDGELGVGYRFDQTTLIKTSLRADRWWVAYGATGFRGQGGPAFAMQVSKSFDAMSWFTRQK